MGLVSAAAPGCVCATRHGLDAPGVVPGVELHGRSFESFAFRAGAFRASNFVASLALAIVIATGDYRLVEVRGRIIRAMADRLLELSRAPLATAEGAPAE
jgi:hypothetical protein